MSTPASPRSVRPLSALAAAFGLLAAVPAGAISGVCPDGSIFIVQHADAIPCRDAKEVEPGDIPPLNPEFLPRPYGWDVFNRETNPNNPYNLIGARPPEGARVEPPRTPPIAATPRTATPLPRTAATPPSPPRPAAATRPASGLALELSGRDLDDLAAIVAVLQDRAPATLLRDADGSRAGLTLRLARSVAFEARVHAALRRAGAPAEGRVVVFHAEATRPSRFWGNLTFVQGHVAHHPLQEDPHQFGVVDGALGPLDAGERVLGYAVLPAHFDLAQPIDIYWDDVLATARLSP